MHTSQQLDRKFHDEKIIITGLSKTYCVNIKNNNKTHKYISSRDIQVIFVIIGFHHWSLEFDITLLGSGIIHFTNGVMGYDKQTNTLLIRELSYRFYNAWQSRIRGWSLCWKKCH